MAPITDADADALKNSIRTLERRVQELEGKLSGKQESGSNPLDAMRMIIMGPPGAGELEVLLASY